MRFVLLGFCLFLAGCVRAPSAAPTPVTVSRPVEWDVTDYAVFTGRTTAATSRRRNCWWTAASLRRRPRMAEGYTIILCGASI